MKYHLSALVTVTIWSLTYISTKIILEVLSPLEISFYRFTIGYLFLLLIKPPRRIKLNFKEDKNLIISGFFGVFLYYIVENSATKMTEASNVSIIISMIPIITSILAHFINRDEKFTVSNIITFIISFSGVALVILNGKGLSGGLPTGNLLALLGAVIFGFYNIFIRRIPPMDPIERGRKINFYGLIFISIMFIFIPNKAHITEVLNIRTGVNILFMGIIASGLCVLMWGYAITGLGATVSSRYIYLAPIITVIASNLILEEGITLFKVVGIILIITGMTIPCLIKRKFKRKNPLT